MEWILLPERDGVSRKTAGKNTVLQKEVKDWHMESNRHINVENKAAEQKRMIRETNLK